MKMLTCERWSSLMCSAPPSRDQEWHSDPLNGALEVDVVGEGHEGI
jgi:hypothetical protein